MSEDLRVTKTRQNIQMTFIRLLEQCRFQDITIKQLIQECQINRSTFYRNYEDKYDLIQKIADDLLVQFQKAINPGFIALNGKKENYISYFSPILHFFEQKKAILKMMARQTLPVNIFDEMHMIYSHALFEELCENYHIHPNSEKKAVYFSQIIASNILTAVKWWQLESSQTSEKEILEMIVLTVTKGILPSLYEQFW